MYIHVYNYNDLLGKSFSLFLEDKAEATVLISVVNAK